MSQKLRFALRDALTKDKFQAWLQLKPSEYRVGYAGTPKGCPIAHYLAFQTGRMGLQVTQSCLWDVRDTYLHRDDPEWPMPPWASDFITAVDQLHPQSAITAKTALALLLPTSKKCHNQNQSNLHAFMEQREWNGKQV